MILYLVLEFFINLVKDMMQFHHFFCIISSGTSYPDTLQQPLELFAPHTITFREKKDLVCQYFSEEPVTVLRKELGL